jgi:hypothetical protein
MIVFSVFPEINHDLFVSFINQSTVRRYITCATENFVNEISNEATEFCIGPFRLQRKITKQHRELPLYPELPIRFFYRVSDFDGFLTL